jgi:hypothetical protein
MTDATNALEALLHKTRADGAKEDLQHILRESTGVKEPGVLKVEVDRLYGLGAFERWLALFELHKFEEAAKVLQIHSDGRQQT